MQLNVTLPSLSEISDRHNFEKIKGYLAILHDQLQYIMLNIDDDNLSDSLSQTINTAYDNAKLANETIISLDDKLSKTTQTAEKINWFIKDSNSSTDFALTSYAASLISESVSISGFVKFSDLENSGETIINGANIKTGSISADKLSVSDLSALSAYVGGWNISSNSISSTASGKGSIYLNSANSSDDCWLKAYNPSGNTTFSISKDGSCYINGDYIANGSVTASKIMTDNNSRLDLLNNYNGTRIGRELYMSSPEINCRLFINSSDILTFDTGTGNSAFSFALNRVGSTYTLYVLNGSGNVVGTINLSS
ncbi:MAG: hypothetical protein E7574_02220 [Ruminococcaceae bacterium]|nr:hypothetical protein [Oscillospiraceae bacterium]